MLFNSIEFLFIFLPVLLIIFFKIGKYNRRLAAAWLAIGSLIFYSWWNPIYVILLVFSITFNYQIGRTLARAIHLNTVQRKRLLTFGVACNLALLGYFKYANFFIHSINTSLGTSIELANIILPLGISFFTFTQIAFLVDAAHGKAKEFNFIHYTLFVTYFPHLIAGPVLHHKEMMPQFGLKSTYQLNPRFITVGLTIFALGLFKKVVLADGVAPYASPLFVSAEQGEVVTLLQAWGGALAYTLQLYFDFSGYSDMAIGLSYMIGVRLPLNFNSPYKATSITEFWRRWHMTLLRFLRDYLYIPLGGNQKGPARRYVNLMSTMLLGGLWHGAGWTFVIWGGLHGVALVVHQAWSGWRVRRGHRLDHRTLSGRAASIALTFVVVVFGWVFFRASSYEAAMGIVSGMLGLHGVSMPDVIAMRMGPLAPWMTAHGLVLTAGGGRDFAMTFFWVATLLPIVFLAPNTQQIMQRFSPVLDYQDTAALTRFAWTDSSRWALAMAVVLSLALLSLTRPSEFLYFQF